MYEFHGVDFTFFKNNGWTFRLCNQDGCFYAYKNEGGIIVKTIVAPSPQELHNRMTTYQPIR